MSLGLAEDDVSDALNTYLVFTYGYFFVWFTLVLLHRDSTQFYLFFMKMNWVKWQLAIDLECNANCILKYNIIIVF